METVTIIGGGIGGLSLASGLKAKGIDYEIYEATDEYKEAGVGITFQINAMQAFDRLGLADELVDVAAHHDGVIMYDADGEILVQHDYRQEFKPKFGWVQYGIRRSVLQEILADHAGPEHIHMGKECVGIDQHGDTVSVEFADGYQTTSRCVVGADGVHSAVREGVFGTTVKYIDCVVHRGLSDWQPPADMQHVLWLLMAPEGHFGFDPLDPDTSKGYWFFTEHGNPGAEYDPETLKSRILEIATGKPPFVSDMIEQTPTDSIVSVDTPYVPPMETWTDGRVTLLGDAAHGMTPHQAQGGCQAVEDALALSICLDEAENLETAFGRYEDLRLERANGFVESSKESGLAASSDTTAHIEGLRNAPDEAIKKESLGTYNLGF